MDDALYQLVYRRDPPPPFTPPETNPVVPTCRGSAANARTWALSFHASGFL